MRADGIAEVQVQQLDFLLHVGESFWVYGG